MLAFSTDDVAPANRLDYWRDTVLRRMEPVPMQGENTPFQGHMIRLPGEQAEMLEHAAEALLVVRTERNCRQDGSDDISIGFVMMGSSSHPEHDSPLRAGDVNIIDCARPVTMRLSRHRTMSLVLRRRRLRELLGEDPARLADLRLPRQGMAAMLQAHMEATIRQAPHMSPADRGLALDIAEQLACAALRTALDRPVDPDCLPLGIHAAALALIERGCTDPELNPLRIAAALGCSRAALYRVFAGQGASISALIWTARLARAHRMLTSPNHADLAINEIAFRSGFVDHPSFNRMFKRRYSQTPGEARWSA